MRIWRRRRRLRQPCGLAFSVLLCRPISTNPAHHAGRSRITYGCVTTACPHQNQLPCQRPDNAIRANTTQPASTFCVPMHDQFHSHIQCHHQKNATCLQETETPQCELEMFWRQCRIHWCCLCCASMCNFPLGRSMNASPERKSC